MYEHHFYGENVGSDIFVHHSNINVTTEQYKYLVQGEYVSFEVDENAKGQHKYQAMNVHGIKQGQLMCETRREVKENRLKYNQTKD